MKFEEVVPEVVARHPTCNFLLEVEKDQLDCVRRLKEEEAASNTKEPGCKGTWDNIACWDRAEFGETVTIPCPRALKTIFGRTGDL
ncbi:hypothetical protein CHARACLAT_010888 [Characodon lateralis]|uniref:G-protein coupled receptors family 2 profile 1 domain-containing protein n=1 Tax=Characodon lateralis TaxID=208331 RepID=A0ABU7D663_9TELE|nr:hypothetical protein [Characodon lateralis]